MEKRQNSRRQPQKKELCSGRVATHIRKVFGEGRKKELWNEIPRYRICILCFTILAVTAHDFSVNTPETTEAYATTNSQLSLPVLVQLGVPLFSLQLISLRLYKNKKQMEKTTQIKTLSFPEAVNYDYHAITYCKQVPSPMTNAGRLSCNANSSMDVFQRCWMWERLCWDQSRSHPATCLTESFKMGAFLQEMESLRAVHAELYGNDFVKNRGN